MCVARNGDDVMKRGRCTQKLQVSLMTGAGYSALYEPREEEHDEGCDGTPAGRQMTKNVASPRKYSRRKLHGEPSNKTASATRVFFFF